MSVVGIGDAIEVGRGSPLLVICGPCVIESQQLCMEIAGSMKDICGRLELPYVFKASFDKANRTSIKSFRGPGLEKGLQVLENVKREAGVPVLTDIHWPPQAARVADVVDAIQIPAFLCRQTDLIVAAAETGLPINLKKGQFMAPHDMKAVIEKAEQCSNSGGVLLCERGTCFGYNELVVDMRSIPKMKGLGYPVIFDVTHSTQKPGAKGGSSGGEKGFAPHLAAAAVAAGADGVFIETHPRPEKAMSDAATMLPVGEIQMLLERLTRLR